MKFYLTINGDIPSLKISTQKVIPSISELIILLVYVATYLPMVGLMEQSNQVYLLLPNILKMKFNNAKLSIGILYIGVIVLASIIALYFQIENHIAF